MSAIHHEDRSALNRGAALASIATAIFLVALKTWATWRTGSTAMLGSLADSALDLVASLATLIGVWIAAMPADEDHRFGHGKAEALAAIFQVMLIALSATGIAYRAIDRLMNGAQTQAAEEGIAVSLIAIAVTLALITWQRIVIARTNSVAIKTDNVHYQSDLLLNMAVIAALVIDQYLGFSEADPLFGLAIAAWLAWGAWRGASEAVDHLMDKEWPEERRDAFLEVLGRHPDIRGVHDLRTRTSGMHDFVQFHMAVDPKLTVVEAHDLMDEVEARLANEFPGVEVLIHPDPEGLVDEEGVAAEELLPDRAEDA
ncbi:ferrous-iron efflux pump FieF [Altererythrobacter xiamenensis]|uniref:Ferrous-iron efflux pump FieF n=1 Tax=Altererythrobacter xiamenensis TaxID=1316679 RepID=A0A1Y6F2M0_9SPHN|nr:cation diffusion facilitator family transporter [Altererythrobacter xiamenensis]SMQ69094.1 ferrous-iron efflux pump FieF [Altererythrobacter xiamenensis]